MKNIWHVVPCNDTREHDNNHEGDCWCNPKIQEQENAAWVIVHNALDGRELKEKHIKSN